jgi:hypothetical protein
VRKPVHAPQEGRESAAREALVLLVEQAQGDEVRRLELVGVVLLALPGLRLRQPAVHADDLQRLLLEVVGLLRVEGEDLEGHLRLQEEQGGHRLRLELLQDLEAVMAVGRPVDPGLRRDDDDRVHEPVDLLDRVVQSS